MPPRLAVRAALALRRGLLALADAVAPPQLVLFEEAAGLARAELLHAVARLGVADLLGAGPRTARELAAAAGCHEDALFRALRALAAVGVFRLRRDGRFQNNRISEAIRSDAAASMREFLEYFGSRSNVAAWADVDRTVATGRSAFRRVHGESIWSWLSRHPHEERTFGAAMAHLTAIDARAIATGYPFGELGRVCDVGGGHGVLLAEILRRHRGLRGVLVDAPQVVAGARPFLTRQGVAERVECVAADVFQAVPPGCDAYLLKDVLHDWDDAAALRILASCRRAAAPGARLLVAEILVDRLSTASPGPLVDVQMMVVTEEGRQRSADEHRRLMDAAGFRPGRIVPLAGPTTVVEGLG